MPEDGPSTRRNMQHTRKGKSLIAVQMCCVRMHKCDLLKIDLDYAIFPCTHKWMYLNIYSMIYHVIHFFCVLQITLCMLSIHIPDVATQQIPYCWALQQVITFPVKVKILFACNALLIAHHLSPCLPRVLQLRPACHHHSNNWQRGLSRGDRNKYWGCLRRGCLGKHLVGSERERDKVCTEEREKATYRGASWISRLNLCYSDDQIQKDKMGKDLTRMGERRDSYRFFVGKREGEKPNGSPRHIWGDIRMSPKVLRWKGYEWIDLAQDAQICWLMWA